MKIIQIKSCGGCPHSCRATYRGAFRKAWCSHPEMMCSYHELDLHPKDIDEDEYFTFPDWCPLEEQE